MFTLSRARAAIGHASQFARGSAYVQEGCVKGVTVREAASLLLFEGEITAGRQTFRTSFEYDPKADAFGSMRCSCGESLSEGRGCRHAAALMIAVCGGAGEPVGPREGGDFITGLLGESRIRPRLRAAAMEEPVQR